MPQSCSHSCRQFLTIIQTLVHAESENAPLLRWRRLRHVTLAQATKADLVFIEDRNGVNACKILKLPFTGVLGILLRMREKGLISKEEALVKLETLQTFGRYKIDIIADVKRRLGVKK